MKIYTKVVIGPNGDVVEQESYDYDGPVAQAFSGGKQESEQSSSSGNKWTMLMDELRYGQEKQRDPFVKQNTQDLNRPTFAGPDGQMFSTSEEASGMGQMRSLSDVTNMLAENKRTFETDGIPMITNKMSAAGYGRTPNVGRAVGQAWMSSIMPTIQEGRGARRDYANTLMAFGSRRLGQGAMVSPLTSSSRSQGTSSGWNMRSFWG